MNKRIESQIQEIAQQPQNRFCTIIILPLYDTNLAEIQQEGREVMRSNHIGNDYPSNQAFVNNVNSAFFNLYDRTTMVDQNYFPGHLIKGGIKHPIAEPAPDDLLSAFFKPNTEFFKQLERLPAVLQLAKTPAQLHYLSQKFLHPGTTTYSELILKNAEQIKQICQAISSCGYQIFNREVTRDGRVRKNGNIDHDHPGQKIIDAASILAEAVTTGQTDIPTPFLLHKNEFNLYLDAVINSSRPENQKDIGGERWGFVLHGAGPDMIKYATGLWKTLASLHEGVAPLLSEMDIPKKVVFGLVPTAELKLSLPESEKDILERLADALLFRESAKVIGRYPDLSDYEKEVLGIIELSSRELIRKLSVDTKVADISFLQSFSKHISQYDLLPDGRIHFPLRFQRVDFKQIREFNNRLGQNLKKRRSNNE